MSWMNRLVQKSPFEKWNVTCSMLLGMFLYQSILVLDF